MSGPVSPLKHQSPGFSYNHCLLFPTIAHEYPVVSQSQLEYYNSGTVPK